MDVSCRGGPCAAHDHGSSGDGAGPDFPSLPGMPRLSWLRFPRASSSLGGAGASGSNTALDPATTVEDEVPELPEAALMQDAKDHFPEPWASLLNTRNSSDVPPDPPEHAHSSEDHTPTVTVPPPCQCSPPGTTQQ